MSQKFFCDNCGTQVKKNADRCPGCGRFFRSVKCPSCGFAGNVDLFSDGCPSCGYAADFSASELFGEPRNESRRADRRFFSGRFYRTVIPLLAIVLAALLVLLMLTAR